MTATTPNLKIPYPQGTDRVSDGDNAMQAIAERIEARMPWGRVASAQNASSYSGQGPVNLCLVTPTLRTGRRYRLSAYLRFARSTVGDLTGISIQRNAIVVVGANIFQTAANHWIGLSPMGEITGDGAALNITLSVARSSGASNIAVDGAVGQECWLFVDDVGPDPIIP